ncbi:hypothetical protein J6590_065773 [Homalodisca vitripennis]|nr:hypothetical protein J6590_065773 [Homalodisca vitripennis]
MISCQGPNSLNSLQFLLMPFCGRILGCLYNGHRHYSHHCDPVYNTLRDENPMGVNRYKSELLTDFIIQRQTPKTRWGSLHWTNSTPRNLVDPHPVNKSRVRFGR